jgi:5'-deoxynucleotidase YfbR-like HD superfamily hydrolase
VILLGLLKHLSYTPESRFAILQHALLHDTGEYYVGDVPFTIKRERPSIAEALERMEGAAIRDHLLELEQVPDSSRWLIKLADMLEGLSWTAAREIPHGPVHRRWHSALQDHIAQCPPVFGGDFVHFCMELMNQITHRKNGISPIDKP